jgi:hypothetical protein
MESCAIGSSGNTESELRSFLGYPEDVPVVEEAYNELVGGISRRFRTDQNMQVKVANRLFLFNTTLEGQFEEKVRLFLCSKHLRAHFSHLTNDLTRSKEVVTC